MKPARVSCALLAAFCSSLAAGVRIEVLRGESENNNASAAGAPPAVRVVDPAGKPVAKALVIFTAPSGGPSVNFGGDGPIAQTETDASGVASAPPIRPVSGDGPVEIQVMANSHGDTANTVIHQMNVGTTVPDFGNDFDVLRLPFPSRNSNKDIHPILIKLLDAAGRGVPGATVYFELRTIKPQGKADIVAQFTTNTGPDGSAQFLAKGKGGNGPHQFLVRATAKGVNSTRIFPEP